MRGAYARWHGAKYAYLRARFTHVDAAQFERHCCATPLPPERPPLRYYATAAAVMIRCQPIHTRLLPPRYGYAAAAITRFCHVLRRDDDADDAATFHVYEERYMPRLRHAVNMLIFSLRLRLSADFMIFTPDAARVTGASAALACFAATMPTRRCCYMPDADLRWLPLMIIDAAASPRFAHSAFADACQMPPPLLHTITIDSHHVIATLRRCLPCRACHAAAERCRCLSFRRRCRDDALSR